MRREDQVVVGAAQELLARIAKAEEQARSAKRPTGGPAVGPTERFAGGSPCFSQEAAADILHMRSYSHLGKSAARHSPAEPRCGIFSPLIPRDSLSE